MSKDDFRDRLKSYSSSPDPGEWSKMEQLLDADGENRKKGFAWWRFGAALLLLGVAAFVVFETIQHETGSEMRSEKGAEKWDLRGEKQEERIESREEKGEKRDLVSGQEDFIEVEEEFENRELRVKSRDLISFEEEAMVVEEGVVEEIDKVKIIEPRTENLDLIVDQEEVDVIETIEEATVVKEIVVEETISEKMVELESPNAKRGERVERREERVEKRDLVGDREDGNFIEQTVVEEIAEVADHEEEVVELELSDDQKLRPWFLASEVGIKYPIVDVENPVVGALVPSQRFFPSYTAGLGLGRSFGRFSAELGISAALYQFKLGEVVAQEQILSWGLQHNAISEDAISTSEEQFVINKFAIASPYLRTQYSIPINKNFLVGLHSVFALNSILNLPNQFESNQIATTNDINEVSVFDFNPLNNTGYPNGNASSISGQEISMNFDVGVSLEKTFADRGRLALDMSYTLATGYLERGSYTAFRESSFASDGTYKISGKGPVVRLRYYLHYGKNS